ncbi:MAG: hypothetical protein A3G87_06810 [Omnitrophica bacterium RIFCSPLOWO2_12_FULL_50_11]|nr:MAG: hypothetical protein A3G87_06810 [Omnitrophica bacterium RIFCSPLOWO2_12_FULL_50_11]
MYYKKKVVNKQNKRKGLTSVQLRPAIARMLARLVKRGASKSELINEALRQYLIEQELNEIRMRLTPYAQAKGIYSDQDLEPLL